MTGLCGRSDRRRGLRPPGPPSQPPQPPCPAPAVAAGPALHRCQCGDQSCRVLEDLHMEMRVDHIQKTKPKQYSHGPDNQNIELKDTKTLHRTEEEANAALTLKVALQSINTILISYYTSLA